MTINELHYDFKIKQNRVDSLTNRDFSVAEIDWLLNEAQLIFIKQRFTNSNKSRKGFETTKKRLEDLSTLVVQYPTQFELPLTLLTSDIYELPLNNLIYTHMFIIGGSVIVKLKDDCFKEVPLRFIQHDDYKQAYRDPFNEPSEESIYYTIGVSTNDPFLTSIFVYPKNLEIFYIRPDYIKYPSKVFYGNYTYIDGIVYAPNTLSTPASTHSEIVDIAVQLATISSQNTEAFQLNNYKLSINE